MSDFSESDINNNRYWEYCALKADNINDALVFIERAEKIAKANNSDNLLNILTRKIHFLALFGQYNDIDLLIDDAEKNYESSDLISKVAFLYQKANRLRFLCQHEKVLEIISNILAFNSADKKVLFLQNKTYVLAGLTYYQSGEYEKTRENYHKSLLLAEKSFDDSLALEIKIMLSFLDAFEGKIAEYNITIEDIEKIPEKKQPVMLLNLAFYWILGDNLNIEKGLELINKTRCIAQKLRYDFLIPLIYDIEARIYRYSKEYEKALFLHEKVLKTIPENSFDFLQAKLNQALTLLRLNKKDEAGKSFEFLINKAKIINSSGLIRQIEAIENKNQTEIFTNQLNEIKSENLPKIKITTFGKFEVRIGEAIITEWKRKKTKNLLACLITNPRGIHRESLAEMLFPSDAIDNPLKSLDVHIHSLRKILEPNRKTKESSFIIFRDSFYQFNWDYPCEIDFVVFSELYKNLTKQGLKDNNIDMVTSFLAIYQGQFLEEIDFADDWFEQREEFYRKFLDISYQLSDFMIKKQAYDHFEGIVNNIIKYDKTNEKAYLKLFEIAEKKNDLTLLKNAYQRATINFKKIYDSALPKELILAYNEISNKISTKNH